MTSLQLPVRGPFSLAESTRFLEGFTPARYRGSPGDGRLRLAFSVDGAGETVGVSVRQDGDGAVLAVVDGDVPDRLPAQLARILSLDVDGAGYPDVVGTDPVVGDLAARHQGLRPVCFFSPYEAACWAVLAQRSSMVSAAAVKERIAERHGQPRRVDGVELWAFPSAERLRAAVDELPVPEVKRSRLRALAEATMDGRLDATRLRALHVEDALAAVRELPGMGPFSAELVVVRGAGAPDVFPVNEGRLHAAMAELYGLVTPTVSELGAVAEHWSPYRSWVSVLIRAHHEAHAGMAGRGGRRSTVG
jgi:DNA-3-methyladenine glycosylase II